MEMTHFILDAGYLFGEAGYLPSLAKISTRFENAVSESLHF
jgi:hypothetical protein